MNDAELSRLDAVDQADLVKRGEASAAELVESAIGRVEALNPTLNAVIATDYERARQAAAAIDAAAPAERGPLAGVPFLIKDIGATQHGLPYWMGNRALKEQDNRSPADTELGARFRRSGLVTLGKTNLPELGTSPTTQPLSCGPTANPWDLDRSPAGSSGGAAAAVASGMVPVAHANDGGGSTRLPAAWCGLVGLKTTRGLVPNPLNTSRLTSELVVSRTVRDTAAVLEAVSGSVDADLFSTPAPRPIPDRPLRVGVIDNGGRIEIEAPCSEAARVAVDHLADMGHRVETVDAERLIGPDSRVNGELWMAGVARRVGALGELAGRPLMASEVEPYNWTAAERGKAMAAHEWLEATERQQRWSAGVVDWMADYDLLVTPTAGTVPMRTDELWPPEQKPWKISGTYARIGLFTLPFNVTGQPAISLPLHWSSDGLPVGVQIAANMGADNLLLDVAARLEMSMPWRDRLPPVHAAS